MADRREVAIAVVSLLMLGGAAWYLRTHTFAADLIEAEQYQRYVAGTYVTQSERPALTVEPCDPPADAPAFTQGWQWYCAKGAK